MEKWHPYVLLMRLPSVNGKVPTCRYLDLAALYSSLEIQANAKLWMC